MVYDPKRYTNLQSIQGSGKFLQGLGESKIIPGINIKAALIFEFGSFMRNVIGIEFGGMAEGYAKQIIIVPTKTNTALYASAFFTFFSSAFSSFSVSLIIESSSLFFKSNSNCFSSICT